MVNSMSADVHIEIKGQLHKAVCGLSLYVLLILKLIAMSILPCLFDRVSGQGHNLPGKGDDIFF